MKAIAVDLGGTHLRAAVAAPGGIHPVGQWRTPGDLGAFGQRLRKLVAEHGAARLGLALPGLADGTRCVWVPNVAYLDDVDLADEIPGVSIVLGNDAQFALLAEVSHGAAKGCRNALLLAVGTGLGSAVLADGRLLRGHNNSAVSLGWACADYTARDGGAQGWLEQVASGRALDRLASGRGLAGGRQLVEAARAGDGEAIEALTRPATALGTVLAGAVALLGSEMIVFAGGAADAFDVLAQPIKLAMLPHLPPRLRTVRLVHGHLGARASLLGAALAAQGSDFWLESES